jgi:hypothetical protein
VCLGKARNIPSDTIQVAQALPINPACLFKYLLELLTSCHSHWPCLSTAPLSLLLASTLLLLGLCPACPHLHFWFHILALWNHGLVGFCLLVVCLFFNLLCTQNWPKCMLHKGRNFMYFQHLRQWLELPTVSGE